MKSFKEYMEESGDSSYSYQYDGKPHSALEHSYSFHSGDGEKYDAFMCHDEDEPTKVHAIFSGTKSKFDISHSQGHKALKVFSTVKNIMAYHAKKHPEIKHFGFTSDKSDPSRSSLYSHGTKKLSGTTNSAKAYENYHTIPAHALGEPSKNPTNHFEV